MQEQQIYCDLCRQPMQPLSSEDKQAMSKLEVQMQDLKIMKTRCEKAKAALATRMYENKNNTTVTSSSTATTTANKANSGSSDGSSNNSDTTDLSEYWRKQRLLREIESVRKEIDAYKLLVQQKQRRLDAYTGGNTTSSASKEGGSIGVLPALQQQRVAAEQQKALLEGLLHSLRGRSAEVTQVR